MFQDLFNKAGNLGLSYLDNKYVNPKDTNATAKDAQAKKYEQIQQKAPAIPQKSNSINPQFIYIGGGVLAIGFIALILKK